MFTTRTLEKTVEILMEYQKCKKTVTVLSAEYGTCGIWLKRKAIIAGIPVRKQKKMELSGPPLSRQQVEKNLLEHIEKHAPKYKQITPPKVHKMASVYHRPEPEPAQETEGRYKIKLPDDNPEIWSGYRLLWVEL